LNAAFVTYVDSVDDLITAGADLDAKDHEGMTALRLATEIKSAPAEMNRS